MSQVRYTRLLEIVHTKGYASIELLAEELGCSQPTIRRDIKKLCEANLLQRFHGGVSQIESSVRLGYESKSGLMQHEKRAIARHVLTHLQSCGDFFWTRAPPVIRWRVHFQHCLVSKLSPITYLLR
ncbi:DeoR family transcriptional regulator [Vibrio sp. PP-XX7]